MAISDKNLFAYCDNNPIVRKDASGECWVLKFFVGVGTQYVGDIIGNVLSGKTGADIFTPTSSLGEYIAAGVTALIPGSGFGGALVRNIVTEGIVSLERRIKGEPNSFLKSVARVAFGTVVDLGVEKVVNKVTKYISSKTPKNYSSFAGEQYKINPGITRTQIYQKMSRSIRWGNRLSSGITFVANAFRSVLPW